MQRRAEILGVFGLKTANVSYEVKFGTRLYKVIFNDDIHWIYHARCKYKILWMIAAFLACTEILPQQISERQPLFTRWMSAVDARPGLTTSVLDMLERKVQAEPESCTNACLMLDAIPLKKHIDFEPASGKYVGFTDLGNGVGEEEEEASEALVFMVVGLRGHWKTPIGYFLTHGLPAVTQAELMRSALHLLHDRGVRVRALTMDGHRTNYSMCRLMGADLDRGVTVCPHPKTGDPVYVILDPCHMQKLMRNLLHAYATISSETGDISWQHISSLSEIQEEMGLKFGNKLSPAHVDFANAKMKFSLSVQTFSSSVAIALEFLRSQRVPGFGGVAATVRFIRVSVYSSQPNMIHAQCLLNHQRLKRVFFFIEILKINLFRKINPGSLE